jgi:ribosome-associated heat shock protein Hsp15
VERVRLDKWLWAARFFKTRSAATEAVLAGHVQVNGGRAKPAREVAAGDSVEVRVGQRRWTVVVTGLADRRGPASVAATLYEETAESLADRERHAAERRLSRPLGADLGARPTKQARRRLDALRRGQRRRPGGGG